MSSPRIQPKATDLAGRRPGFVEISCADVGCFRSLTPDELAAQVDLVLEAGRRSLAGIVPRARYNEVSQAAGLNANPDGLLADRAFRYPVVI